MFYEKNRSPVSSYCDIWICEDMNFPRHLHRCFEFIDVLEGEMKVLTGDKDGERKEYLLDKSKAAMFLPFQAHEYITEKSSECLMCIFTFDHTRTFYEMIKNRSSSSPVFIFSDSKLEDTMINLEKDDILTLKSCLYAVCAQFYSQNEFTGRSAGSASSTDLLDRILNYIELHFCENITLKQIAQQCGYSYHYMSNFFNMHLGVNFRRFLNEFRIHRACVELMENKDKSISELASECGFDNLRSFNRAFLSITGTTASEYRKNKGF